MVRTHQYRRLGPQILSKFYSYIIESILSGCITAWYGNYLVFDRKALQSVVHTVQYITGAELLAIQDLCNRLCQRLQPQVWDQKAPEQLLP
jgi:hypothetical protein